MKDSVKFFIAGVIMFVLGFGYLYCVSKEQRRTSKIYEATHGKKN